LQNESLQHESAKEALTKLQSINNEEVLITTSREDSEILKKAMIILENNGYTIWKKYTSMKGLIE